MAYEDYIRENLNNLGELSRNDFLYLSENVSLFFVDGFSERSLSRLRHLFKLVSYEDLPENFYTDSIQIKFVCGNPCFVNDRNQLCFEDNGVLISTPVLKLSDFETFINMYKEALIEHKITNRWKANTNVNELKDFDNYIVDDGSVVSLKDQDIKNICKSTYQSSYSGNQLLKAAIENGGIKSESYQSQFDLFIRNGFVPISACKFDIKRASKLWLKQNGLTKDSNLDEINLKELVLPAEDKIFYIYMNNESAIYFEEWIKTIEYSDNYDEARAKRDRILNRIMEEGK